jgi:hypothetical protein
MGYESYIQRECAKAGALTTNKLEAVKVSQMEDVMHRLIGAIENIENTSSRLQDRLTSVVNDTSEDESEGSGDPVSIMLDARIYQLTKRIHRVDYALSKLIEGLTL